MKEGIKRLFTNLIVGMLVIFLSIILSVMFIGGKILGIIVESIIASFF